MGGKGKPSLLGLASGVVAGLVAVTPASGFAGPMGSIVLGIVAGGVCFAFCSTVKNAFGYDDALDVFGIHAVGGILGALATGILVNPRSAAPASRLRVQARRAHGRLLLSRHAALGPAQGRAADGRLVGHRLLHHLQDRDVVVGLRVTQEQEREGLDIAEHGERAYNY